MTSTMKPAKRILCVLLAFLMVFTACFMPMAEAVILEATAASSGAIYVVGCMLIAGGFAIARGDLNDVAASMYRAGSTGFRNLVDATAAVWDKGGKFAVKVSAELKDAFNSLVDSLYASDTGILTNPAVTSWGDCIITSDMSNFDLSTLPCLPDFSQNDTIYTISDDAMYLSIKSTNGASVSNKVFNGWVVMSDISDARIVGYVVRRFDANESGVKAIASYVYDGITKYTYTDVPRVGGTTLYISDSYMQSHDYMGSSITSGWYVGKVTDTPTWYDIPTDAIIKSPDGITQSEDLADAAPADVLRPNYDLSQDKIDTFPVDVPYPDVQTGVDAGAGVGEGEGEGTGEGAGEGAGLWDWLKNLLKDIFDAIKSILAAIVGFFDTPADFRLNFDGFKNMRLPTRFPFCIPFDFVNAIRVFARNAQDFQFRIDLETSYFQIHHVVDLTPFILPIAFFRYTACIWFGLVLINKTRDLIKW